MHGLPVVAVLMLVFFLAIFVGRPSQLCTALELIPFFVFYILRPCLSVLPSVPSRPLNIHEGGGACDH